MLTQTRACHPLLRGTLAPVDFEVILEPLDPFDAQDCFLRHLFFVVAVDRAAHDDMAFAVFNANAMPRNVRAREQGAFQRSFQTVSESGSFRE